MQVREKIILSTLEGRRSGEVSALFDTGAKFTYISDGVGKELGIRRKLGLNSSAKIIYK